MKIPVLDAGQILKNLSDRQNAFFPDFKIFYSSWLGGLVKDPHFMLLPMDDHMVHRGDAVFEAIKFINRHVILMDEHLDRLFFSAKRIGLNVPHDKAELKALLFTILQESGVDQGLVRLFVSRGPGGYTTNPYDSLGAQLYVTITTLKPPTVAAYAEGVSIGRSQIPVKEGWMAQVKSCNYLPNVLMKKESVDRGLAFTVSFDQNLNLAESSTENIALVDRSGNFVFPKFDHILKGTTLVQVATIFQKKGGQILQKNISENDLIEAHEVMMIGTTLDILPVVSYESRSIGNGRVGPWAQDLLISLRESFVDFPKF